MLLVLAVLLILSPLAGFNKESTMPFSLVGIVSRVKPFMDVRTGVIYSYVYLSVRESEVKLPQVVVVKVLGGEIPELDLGFGVDGQPLIGEGDLIKVTVVIIGEYEGKTLLKPKGQIEVITYKTKFDTPESCYRLIRTGSGKLIKWRRKRIPFYINIKNVKKLFKKNSKAAIKRITEGALAWDKPEGAHFHLRYKGGKKAKAPKRDNKNVVMFTKIDGKGGTLGIAYYWYEISTGKILEADTIFDRSEKWYVGKSKKVPSDKVDLASVAAHEFGHWAALGHVPRNPKKCGGTSKLNTMYPEISKGDSKYRDIYVGDLNGIKRLYPKP